MADLAVAGWLHRGAGARETLSRNLIAPRKPRHVRSAKTHPHRPGVRYARQRQARLLPRQLGPVRRGDAGRSARSDRAQRRSLVRWRGGCRRSGVRGAARRRGCPSRGWRSPAITTSARVPSAVRLQQPTNAARRAAWQAHFGATCVGARYRRMAAGRHRYGADGLRDARGGGAAAVSRRGAADAGRAARAAVPAHAAVSERRGRSRLHVAGCAACGARLAAGDVSGGGRGRDRLRARARLSATWTIAGMEIVWAPATSFFNIVERQHAGMGVPRAGYVEWTLTGRTLSHRLVEPPLMLTHDVGAWNQGAWVDDEHAAAACEGREAGLKLVNGGRLSVEARTRWPGADRCSPRSASMRMSRTDGANQSNSTVSCWTAIWQRTTSIVSSPK